MVDKEKIEKLKEIALRMRKDILEMTTISQSGHPTSSMSCIDILVALYFSEMKYDPKKPDWPDRDRFILSKGHASPSIYVCLAEAGYFGKEELKHFREIDSLLQGHPSPKTPGVETATGSLGLGLSFANGMGWAAELDKRKYHSFVVMGDGELQEGQCWESIMSTPFFGLSNVTLIIDRNGLQNDGWVKETKSLEPLDKKFESFGWEVININGHKFEEILPALEKARNSKKPVCIIAKTIKGKGVKFIENDPDMHGKTLSKEELEKALEVLE